MTKEQFWQEMKKPSKGGFVKHEPFKQEKGCRDPEHKPPRMIVLAPGKHTYVCPACGQETIINISLITL